MKNYARRINTLALASAVGLAALALAGCSKVTQENYDKLKMGMDYAEVVQLLGEPDQCEAMIAAKSCVWGKAPRTITIQLVADKVVLFQGQGL
jgi:hypothetical protein